MDIAQPDRTAVACELAAEIVRAHGRVRFRALGTSMLPAIWPGDVLSVKAVPISDLSPGEVVLFSHNSRLVAHRVVRRTGARLITRGDATPGMDPPVGGQALLGRVVAIERGGRHMDVRPPGTAERLLAWGLRRSHLLLRIVLRLHRLRRRGRAAPEISYRDTFPTFPVSATRI